MNGIGYRSYGAWSYEYRSRWAIGSWPLVHICGGADPITLRPRVARGILAIGDIAIGIVAIGGLACGFITVAGCSLGMAAAIGGVALSLGPSIGGVAVGSVAIGGVAIGTLAAIGGAAFGPN